MSFKKMSPRILSIVDQGIHSAFSFIIVLVAGRILSQSDFGSFSLVWSAYPISLFLFSSAFSNPLSIVYPGGNQKDKKLQDSFVKILFNFFILVFIFSLFASVLLFSFLKSSLFILISLGFALCSIRFSQELHRRLFIAKFQIFRAVIVSLSFLSPGIILIPFLLLTPNLADNPVSYLFCVVVSLTTMHWMVYKDIKQLPTIKSIKGKGGGALKPYAIPLFSSALIETICKRLAPYLLAFIQSTKEVGAWSAGRLLMGPMQVILIGLSNSSVPLARKAFVEEGKKGLLREIKKLLIFTFFFYIIPIVVTFSWADKIIFLAFGVVFKGSVAILRLYCICFAIMGVSIIFSTYLTARGIVRQQVVISIISSALYVFCLPVVTYRWGAIGIAGLSIAGEITSVLIYLIYSFQKSEI